jgi:F420-0:gamma-glutamyl ligase-like protein
MRAFWPGAVLKLATVGRRSWAQWCSAGWVRVMGISVELRNDAVECLRLASQVKARRHKALLMDLARAWICVAEHMEQMRAAHGQGRGQARRLYQ